jgi:hypothetical protein
LPGGAYTHWKAPPLHGARQQQTHASQQIAPYDQPVDAGERGLFGQPRLPKTLDQQLRV